VQNQKRQLSVLQAAKSAAKSDTEEPMKDGDSDLEGDSCKHSALMRQCKTSCKGKDGKS
jgi:hypothetical protein